MLPGVIQRNFMDKDLIKECMERLLDANSDYSINKNYVMVLPYDQLQKYKSLYVKKEMKFETFQERGFGTAVFSYKKEDPNLIGNIVHYSPMRGQKIQLKAVGEDKLDIYVKILHLNDDILLIQSKKK